MSALEDTLTAQLKLAGLPIPIREFKAIQGRRFRWDLAWPDHWLLVEVQGGVWNAGKHGRGSGILKDQEKLNLAQLAGWTVLQVSENHIRDGQALRWVQEFFREP